jgi:hypothetical protein
MWWSASRPPRTSASRGHGGARARRLGGRRRTPVDGEGGEVGRDRSGDAGAKGDRSGGAGATEKGDKRVGTDLAALTWRETDPAVQARREGVRRRGRDKTGRARLRRVEETA